METKHYKYTYFGIAAHPHMKSRDGLVTHIVRNKADINKSQFVPLFDHHEYDKEPIGACKLMYVPVSKIGDSDNYTTTVIAEIHTDFDLQEDQALSISYGEVGNREDGISVGIDVLEVSIVDKPFIPKCQIYAPAKFTDAIKGLANGEV